MSAWGTNGSARSCEALLRRLETNDPTLVDLVVLPLKHFGSQELIRVAVCLGTTTNTTLRSLQASGHAIDDCHAFELLGRSMVSIEKIAIGDSKMGDPGLMALCRGLETNPTMQLHDTTTKTNTHTKGTNCNKLRSIDLSYKNIGPKGLRALLRVCSSSSLSLSASLQSLDLSRNTTIGPSFDFGEYATATATTTPPTSPLVPASLPTLFPCLTYLNLSECQLDTKSCTSLFKAMMMRIQQQEQQQNRKLILKLNSNPLNSSSYSNDNTNTNPEDNNLHEMITILVRGNRVSELELARCGIGNTGLAQMIDAAACCSSHSDSNDNQNNNKIDLERLDLSNNKITSVSYLLTTAQQKQQQLPPSAPKLSHYFSHLRSLNLSGNSLGATLTNSIFIEECSYPMIMMMSSVLEELDLSQTSCDVSAAVALIRWCSRSNTSTKQNTMKTLNLFGNHFGSEGLIALSTVLQGGHPSLEYLDLGGNNASEEAVVALVQGLTEPLVVVHQTAATVAAENKDDDTIPKNKNKLRVLVVGGNGGGPALEKAVKVVNKVHPELDIARTKVKKNEEDDGSGNSNNSMFNSTCSTPGTTWMS